MKCKYCNKRKNEPLIAVEGNTTYLEYVDIQNRKGEYRLVSGIGSREISYCPVCGRRLDADNRK